MFLVVSRSSTVRGMSNSYTTTAAFMVSNVSGIMGLPASSFTGDMLAAQRIDAMSMNSVLLAMRRPMQILQQRITNTSKSWDHTGLLT